MSNINQNLFNQELSSIFNILADYYVLEKETYKAKAFRNSGNILSKHEKKITSADEAIKIKGIGKSSAEIIDEYLKTGKVQRLEKFNEKYIKNTMEKDKQKTIKLIIEEQKDKPKVIELFKSVYGIGPESANKFYEQGFRTIEDLYSKATLTESQKLGLIWKEHIDLRINRDEMDIINETLNEYLSPYNIKWTIAGSYRRGEPTSGDVDVLIEKQPNIKMDNIVDILKNILPATLAQGETKYMGIIRLSEETNGHRIDIRLIEPIHYPVALLYFTGSKEFNILIRNHALDLGMSLNEYTLTNIPKGETITSEEDIFRVLGIEYVPPNKRKETLRDLKLLN